LQSSSQETGPVVSADVQPDLLGRALVGAGAGIAAALMLTQQGFGARGLIDAFTAVVLVVLAAIDYRTRLLPNRIVLPAAAVVLTAQLVFFSGHAPIWIGASLGTALFLFIPTLISPRAVGMGDVKLGLLIGAALGKHVPEALLLASLAMFPVALGMLVRNGREARGSSIAFGPFLALGSIVTLALI
jgi:prepilin signal peptidase PulO-like enzyme (type II secretory pathway)